MITTFLLEVTTNWVTIELHRCPQCTGVFGVDASFTDQVDDHVNCPMCSEYVNLSDDLQMYIIDCPTCEDLKELVE